MSLFGSGRKEGFLAVVLLIALALLQHAPGALLGQPRGALDPAAFAEDRSQSVPLTSEAATNQTILLPAMRQAGEVVAEGSLPTWNPYARLGEPFHVTGAPLLYPPFWPLMLSNGGRWLDWILLLHSAIACTLAYRMLRALSVSRYGAFLGAGIYGLGWFFTTALDRLPEAAAAAWLPWIVEASWRMLLATRRGPRAAALGVAVAVPFLTGGVATATLGAGLAILCGVAGMLVIEREERLPAARSGAIAALLAVLLTAPIWLTAIEHAGAVAPRSDVPIAHLQVGGLCALLVPGMFGELGGGAPHALRAVNPGADSLELALYPGALTLFVALMGLLRPKRTRLALFWLLVAGGSLLLALDGPVAELWRKALPFVVDRPGAVLAVFHLATVVLVALGLENFFDAPRARWFAVPATASVVLVCAMVAAFGLWMSPGLAADALSALVGEVDARDLDAAVAHAGRTAVVPLVAGSLIAIAFLIWRRIGILRFKTLLATAALGELCFLALAHVPRNETATDARLADLVPSTGTRVIRVGEPGLAPGGWIAARRGLSAIDSDGDRILSRTSRYLETIEPGLVQVNGRVHVGPLDRPVNLEHPRLHAIGVGAAVSTRPPPIGTFLPIPANPTSAARAGRAMPYVALDPVPRFRIAFRVEAVADAAAAERALQRSTGPIADQVVVEGAPPEFVPSRPAQPPVIEVVEDTATRAKLRVDVGDGRGYLVVADAIGPGWTAEVDGQPTRILPADLALRAIPLREGVHEVVLEHRSLGWIGGAVLAMVGTLAAAFLALRRR